MTNCRYNISMIPTFQNSIEIFCNHFFIIKIVCYVKF